jgi:hypothetical protein
MTHPITLVVCGVISLVAAVSGPFGTIVHMGFGTRAVYWTLVVFGTTLAANLARALAGNHVSKDRPFLFEACALGLMVFLATPVVLLLRALFGNAPCTSVSCAAQTGLYVAIISAAVFLARRVLPGFEDMMLFVRNESGSVQVVARAEDVSDSPEPPEPPRLYRRLPGAAPGRILHLTAKGHFVTVTTETGCHDIRMRFSDAISEMDAEPGYCTHRSHWVATWGVCGDRRVDGKLVLVLVNGMEVPVSRTYRPELEAVGLVPPAGQADATVSQG